jgi:AcrR family transcriptional regulator
MATNTHDSQETRQRLLDAAGEIFAEHGFRHTTVREICDRAAANVAAVNYHFRDKEGLYSEVLRYAHRCLVVQPQRDMTQYGSAPADQRLRVFVHLMMHQLFEAGKPAWHGKLVAREMIDPTAALDRLVQEEIRPKSQFLQSVVREIIGPAASQRDVELSTLSVISQCVFYRHSKAVISRLHPELKFTPDDIDALADHIANFSLAALANWPAGAKGSKP